MSIIKTDTGIKVTKSSGGRKKGAKRSKANKPSRVKYRATGRMFKNHESKLKALARKLQRRIDRGATPPRKVENLKRHIGDLLEAAKRWSDKRFR